MNIKEDLTKKLDLLEEKISILEQREAESKKVENLLHAFNKATLAMEKVIMEP